MVGSPPKVGLLSKLDFRFNEKMGIGVEIEVQFVDAETGDLKPLGPAVLEHVAVVGDVRGKAELFQSMLEIDSPICTSAIEAGKSLRHSLGEIRRIAGNLNSKVVMSGTHPFANYSERLLTPSGRYYSLMDRNQWIARRLQIFGLHVHLGMRDGEHAIAMNNALCHYLPFFLALSASSPYWHAEDTGLASSRITFFEAIPTGGHPCLMNSWGDFEVLIQRLIRSRSIGSIKDLWWDIRPNTEYGTIEIRIADCPPTMTEVQALVALIHTVAVFIDTELRAGRKFAPPPEWVLRENKWRASRHGVECDLIQNIDGLSRPFAELWHETTSAFHHVISEFEYESEFLFLNEILEKGPSYKRQRIAFTGDFDSVIQHLIREGEADRPEWPAV